MNRVNSASTGLTRVGLPGKYKRNWLWGGIAMGLVTLLTACGGGGGGSDSQVAAQPEVSQVQATPMPSATPELPSNTTTTEPAPGVQSVVTNQIEDLVAPADFDFDPTEILALQVNITELDGTRAYLSVYERFYQKDTGKYPVTNSKIGAARLIAGKAELALTVAPDSDTLLAEIWFYDGRPPLQKVLSVSGSTLVWN